MEKIRPGIVLEIGVGSYPYRTHPSMVISLDGRELIRKFDRGSLYIGIDRPDRPEDYWINYAAGEKPRKPFDDIDREYFLQQLTEIQTRIKKLRPGESANLVIADGHMLPFRDDSVDEVFLSNVVGSQLTEKAEDAIFREIRRVLKSRGKVVIKETLTPHLAFAGGKMADFLLRHGLRVLEVVPFESTRYNELQDTYGVGHEELEEFSDKYLMSFMFYVVAEKLK